MGGMGSVANRCFFGTDHFNMLIPLSVRNEAFVRLSVWVFWFRGWPEIVFK